MGVGIRFDSQDRKIKMFEQEILASEIARKLGCDVVGHDVVIDKATSLHKATSGAVFFVKKYSAEIEQQLNYLGDCLAFVSPEFAGRLEIPHIVSENPRLSFARLLSLFFDRPIEAGIADSAVIHSSAKIGKNVFVGDNVVIEEGVIIGDHTVIFHNVVVSRNSEIGSNCFIKSGTVIGQKGFGFEKSSEGMPITIPQIGSVVIGNNVEIGSCCTVVRGTLDNTIIKDNVKIDDHVHIAHNVYIGENALITACVEISGSVQIAKDVWIGPNSSIINRIKVGDNSYIGIGSVVIRSVPDGVTVVGNPARQLIKS
jgi:UDP-3-O-[3-hydroxymyristoyl] glucosamine N-acyltransferase